MVNPMQSQRAQLRKVKTDTLGALHLAEMYDRGGVKPHHTWDQTLTELQHLIRQHEFVTGIFVPSCSGMPHVNYFPMTLIDSLRSPSSRRAMEQPSDSPSKRTSVSVIPARSGT